MKIWTFVDYNMLPVHGTLNRHYYLGRALAKLGNDVTVFAGSHPHNTTLQLIEGKEKYRVFQTEPFPWVLVKTLNYTGSTKKRVISMLCYYHNAKVASKAFGKPDAIIGSSAHPLCAVLAIRLARKLGAKAIVEVRDLWPESIVAYGIAGPNNPAIRCLRRLEKWMYMKADAIVFTMGGGYEYIKDMHWDDVIPREKVTQINNGIDLEAFDYNKSHYQIKDADLEDDQTIKIVYTGSLKHGNEQIKPLFDAIEMMKKPEYDQFRFLIYGGGELEDELKRTIEEKQLRNVKMKGRVEKKYIPYILSKCDVAVLNCASNEIMRYGGSQNKLFDYLASGLSIVSGEDNPYSIVRNENCGISENFRTTEELVEALDRLSRHPIDRDHIRSVAKNYDFTALAQKLLDVINNA